MSGPTHEKNLHLLFLSTLLQYLITLQDAELKFSGAAITLVTIQ